MRRPHPYSTLFPYTTLFRSEDAHRRPPHRRRVPSVRHRGGRLGAARSEVADRAHLERGRARLHAARDRKSTRLNSSHVAISYAVFCLKKKKNTQKYLDRQQD